MNLTIPEILGLLTLIALLIDKLMSVFGNAGIKALEKSQGESKEQLARVLAEVKNDISMLSAKNEAVHDMLNRENTGTREMQKHQNETIREALKDMADKIRDLDTRFDKLIERLIRFTEKT